MRPALLLPLVVLAALAAGATSGVAFAQAGSAATPAAPPGPRVVFRPAAPPPLGPATAPAPSTRPTARAARPKAPPPPALPAPDVHLTLDAPTLDGPWTMRATNTGTVPVRLAADARLIALDVTARGEHKPVRCALPADMRPADDLDRALVLPPGRTYSETFEPRLYCFGEHAGRALAPQASVVAKLGWAAGSRSETRQAVSPIDGVEPLLGSIASLEAPPVSLPDEPTPTPTDVAATPAAVDSARLRVTSSPAVDAQTADGISVVVTLHNDGSRPVRTRFRPETLAFDVTSANGTEPCVWPSPVGAPLRELYSTLGAHASESLSVILADYCSRKPFEQPGLIVIRAQLDTRHAGGAELGLSTFDGQVIAVTPTLLRLHSGTGSMHLHRPHLDPGP